jgi:hypothetical protein
LQLQAPVVEAVAIRTAVVVYTLAEEGNCEERRVRNKGEAKDAVAAGGAEGVNNGFTLEGTSLSIIGNLDEIPSQLRRREVIQRTLGLTKHAMQHTCIGGHTLAITGFGSTVAIQSDGLELYGVLVHVHVVGRVRGGLGQQFLHVCDLNRSEEQHTQWRQRQLCTQRPSRLRHGRTGSIQVRQDRSQSLVEAAQQLIATAQHHQRNAAQERELIAQVTCEIVEEQVVGVHVELVRCQVDHTHQLRVHAQREGAARGHQ